MRYLILVIFSFCVGCSSIAPDAIIVTGTAVDVAGDRGKPTSFNLNVSGVWQLKDKHIFDSR